MVKKGNNKRSDLLNLILGLIILVLINVISGYAFKRFDLTTEKRFTLSDATIDMLKNLDDVVFVRVYLEGDFPAGFKRLRNATKEMLDEFRAIAGDNIQYEFIDPSASPDEKERNALYAQLTRQGIQYTNLEFREGESKSEKIIFPGAIVAHKEREAPVQILKSQIGVAPEVMLNNSVQQLEYELANTIRKLASEKVSTVAFIEGHGELDSLFTADIMQSLAEYYNVTRLKLNEQLKALQNIDAIVIAKPDSAFSEKDKFIIDQFIMRGGKALWMIDRTDANMDSLNKSPNYMALTKDLNLDDMLFNYGVRINTNLVQDIQAVPIPIVIGYIGNQPQQKFFPWFYFPLIMPYMKHPIVNNLNAIKAEFISTIDTVGTKGIRKTPLLHTSKYAKVLPAPVRVSINMLREEPKMEQFNKSFQPLAVLLEGEFESNFKNRLAPELLDSKEINFREKGVATKMIVVADGDIIKNQVQYSTGRAMPLGFDKYTNEVYGNKNFILNAMNYLLDDSGLIGARSKEIKLRLLDIDKLRKERARWQFLNVVIPVLLVVLYGIIRFYWRKRRYTTAF
jgi:gliding-associated putative ABC transporter substrate-binding component GldG